MSAIAETPFDSAAGDRSPSAMRWCWRSGRRSRAQQHGDRRDRQHPRLDDGAGQKPRDLADQHHGVRHLGRHLAARILAKRFGRRTAYASGAVAAPSRA
jgi:hypothetical protein